MPFPEVPRTVYRNNPLIQVICQVRFPPILRIDVETPVAFQERVRRHMPEYELTVDESVDSLPQRISNSLPPEIREFMTTGSNRRHQFFSKDRSWTVSLTRDFVALETSKYEQWNDFRERLQLIITTLLDVYEPAYFTRIGLRYKNAIDRERLNLAGSEWSDLISDFVLGPLARAETSRQVVEHHGKTLVILNDAGDKVRMEYGQVTDSSLDTTLKLFLLDNDFYTNEETPSDAEGTVCRLDRYNRLNGHLFRWCITDRLHKAMGPP